MPRPRTHLTRYFGVFAPAFTARAAIVPAGRAEGSPAPRASGRRSRSAQSAGAAAQTPPWASLIWRVFLQDVLECARCKGRMEIVAALTSRPGIERVLGHLGLPLAAPRFHPARPPPQSELSFADETAGFDPDPPAPEDIAA